MNHFDLQMLFGGFDLTPDRFIGHFHNLGRLVDRAGLLYAFQDFHAAFTEDDVVVPVHNPVAGS